MVGFGIGVLVAIIGASIWRFFAGIVADWEVKRISTRLAARKEADKAKAIHWKGISRTSIGPDR